MQQKESANEETREHYAIFHSRCKVNIRQEEKKVLKVSSKSMRDS